MVPGCFCQYCGNQIGRHRTLRSCWPHEDASAIAPDLASEDLLNALRATYPPDKESSGVAALEIKPGGVATDS